MVTSICFWMILLLIDLIFVVLTGHSFYICISNQLKTRHEKKIDLEFALNAGHYNSHPC